MRKYFITRKSAVTSVSLKVVNSSTYEVLDYAVQLNGAFSSTDEAMEAVNKSWHNAEFKPIAVTDMTTTIKTFGMTAQQWFEEADVVEETVATAEEAAQFGKRAKRSEASGNL